MCCALVTMVTLWLCSKQCYNHKNEKANFHKPITSPFTRVLISLGQATAPTRFEKQPLILKGYQIAFESITRANKNHASVSFCISRFACNNVAAKAGGASCLNISNFIAIIDAAFVIWHKTAERLRLR